MTENVVETNAGEGELTAVEDALGRLARQAKPEQLAAQEQETRERDAETAQAAAEREQLKAELRAVSIGRRR